MENLNRTFKQLIALFDEKEPTWSDEKKHSEANKAIDAYGLEYYVTLMDFKLSDIGGGARVKTPAKYFKTYEAAKIFQLASIIEKQRSIESGEYEAGYAQTIYAPEEIQEMREKLAELVDEFPEYAV